MKDRYANIESKDWISHAGDYAGKAPNRWYACAPLLCHYQGDKFYLGTAAYVLPNETAIVRNIYQGATFESSLQVLEKTIAMLPKEPPTT